MSKTTNAFLMAAIGAGASILARALVRRLDSFDLEGKTVLITGGSRGLGLVLARKIAAEGARVAICARDADELERALADLEGQGADVFAVRCDLTDRYEVTHMVQMVESRFGRIDLLVNNAGTMTIGPMEMMSIGDYEQAMQTHFWGPLSTILAVLPGMRERRSGRIVNIVSIGGKVSVPHLLPYCASKFALSGLSKGLRAELARDGIVVTTVYPGLMRTGGQLHAETKGKHEKEFAWFSILDSLPLVSVSVESAASDIISALKKGEGEVVVSVPAKLLDRLNSASPELVSDLLGMANHLLPSPDGGADGSARQKGSDIVSDMVPAFLRKITERSARKNNETDGEPIAATG
jgi:NAD(P)-dependent dehydrogenase (short-subunit alcohol dehydrogenase family)